MTTPATAVRTAASVDDLLGPAPLRFFGEGYRRTRPRLHELSARHRGSTSGLTARGAISPDAAWSVKDGAHQRPHLATTDVIALTAQAVGVLLASRFDPVTAAATLLTELEVHAADRPLEDDLGEFSVRVDLEDDPVTRTARFHAAVGPLSASGVLVRPAASASLAELDAPAALSPVLHGGPYGPGLAAREQRLVDVRIADGPDGPLARAASSLLDRSDAGSTGLGLEGAGQPGYTVVDVFVATLQLGQVLLYELDGLDRGTSSTLWMRRTVVSTTEPLLAGDGPVEVSVQLDRARVVAREDGRWRLADVVGVVGPYRVRVAVAHRVATRPGAARPPRDATRDAPPHPGSQAPTEGRNDS